MKNNQQEKSSFQSPNEVVLDIKNDSIVFDVSGFKEFVEQSNNEQLKAFVIKDDHGYVKIDQKIDCSDWFLAVIPALTVGVSILILDWLRLKKEKTEKFIKDLGVAYGVALHNMSVAFELLKVVSKIKVDSTRYVIPEFFRKCSKYDCFTISGVDVFMKNKKAFEGGAGGCIEIYTLSLLYEASIESAIIQIKEASDKKDVCKKHSDLCENLEMVAENLMSFHGRIINNIVVTSKLNNGPDYIFLNETDVYKKFLKIEEARKKVKAS